MAFLFKSKKNQSNAVSSQTKDQPAYGPTPPNPATPSAGASAGGVRDRERDREKESIPGQTSSPPGSGWSNAPTSASPPGSDQKPLREKAEQDVLPPRSGSVPPPVANNPNALLYPWSQRRFHFTTNHPNPFPRYGAAVNAVASKEGEIYMMGGLIDGSMVKGDLWMIEADGPHLACYPIPTTAEGPGPRVGHASLIVGNAFIVFGGDTKVEERDDLDDTLYLLNTTTRSWTRAITQGVRPAGRYGHTLNMVGSKLFVFGGQVEGFFFNDLVAFDLNALQAPSNQWELLIPSTADGAQPAGPVPPARTNHTMVNWEGKLFLFGGTNSVRWFNDVWTYDPRTNRWTQLDCIGYIPVPREGHAAALVGDVMYIFGGRTKEGDDLGDLAAFRISSRRWYTFQNMGPSPSPRSGHSMTAHGKQIVVVGGEPSSAPRDEVELSLVYVLDTGKIRYPNDQASPGAGNRRPSGADRTQTAPVRAAPSRDGPGTAEGRDPRRIAAGPRESLIGSPGPFSRAGDLHTSNGPVVGAATATGAGAGVPAAMQLGSRLPRAAASQAPSGPPPAQQAPPPRTNGILPTPPVPRSKTPTRAERGMSPGADAVRSGSIDRETRENVSPVKQDSPSLSEQPAVNGRRTPTTQPQRTVTPAKIDEADEITPTESLGRSKSLQGRQQPAVHADVNEAAPPKQTSPGWAPPDEPPAPAASRDVVRRRSSSESRILPHLRHQNDELAKELSAATNRNAWYASELALARRAGYVPNPSDSPVLDEKAAETFGEKDRPLLEAFLAMKAELERVQGSIEAQAALAASKIAEAENQRDVAVSEAVYAKAKLAAHGGSQASTPQLDSSSREVGDREAERAVELNRRLASSLALQAELQSKMSRFEVELKSERQARQLAENLADAAEIRVADLDSFKQRASSELEGLRAELYQVQKVARDEAAKATEADAAANLLRAERDDLQRRLEEVLETSKTHAASIGSMRDAVVASTEKATLLEKKLEAERHHQETVERKLRHLRAEHEEMTAELETVARRLRDAEDLVEVHSAEAEKHRTAMLSGLGQAADRDLGALGHMATEERVAILQDQVEASTALVRKSQAAADAAAEKLRGAEERVAELEAHQEQMSREGLGFRRQLQGAAKHTQALQAENAEIRAQLANQKLEADAIAVQHGALKDLLGERGINVSQLRRSRSASRQDSTGSGTPEQSRVRELEQQLEASIKAQSHLQHQFQAHEQEANRVFNEKIEQLQNDFQSAVHYIKGTEKMLSKYKAQNAHLHAELEQLQQRSRSAEAAASTPEVSPTAAAAWEAERRSLRDQIETLQSGVNESVARLEKQLGELRSELDRTRQERDQYRDTSQHVEHELALLAEQARADLEQLKHENSMLESRALDAEQKVGVLLDQLVTSVDNYRRQSRLMEPNGVIGGGGPEGHSPSGASGTRSGSGHRREDSLISGLSQDSSSSSPARGGDGGGGGGGSLSRPAPTNTTGGAGGLGTGADNLSFRPDTRNSVALDSLASELETLRSHWESTNKHYFNQQHHQHHHQHHHHQQQPPYHHQAHHHQQPSHPQQQQQQQHHQANDRAANAGLAGLNTGVVGLGRGLGGGGGAGGTVGHGRDRDNEEEDLSRLSTDTSNFDFERTPTSIDGGELSNSLANWRRRLDLEEQEAAAAAATAGGGGGGGGSGGGIGVGIGIRGGGGGGLNGDEVDGEATPRRKGSGGDGGGAAGAGAGGGGGGGGGGTGTGPPLI